MQRDGMPIIEARAGARPDGYNLYTFRVFTRRRDASQIETALFSDSFQGLKVPRDETVHIELGMRPDPNPEQLEVAFVLGDGTLIPYTSHVGEVLHLADPERVLEGLRQGRWVGLKVVRL